MLNIEVLGNFHLRYNNQPLSRINTAKLQSVFVYLLLHCQTPQSRYYSATTLWPDSTDSQARTNLRKYLHQLRQALPDSARYFCADNNTVQWLPTAPYILDAAEFEEAIKDAKRARAKNDVNGRKVALTNAVETYRGDLMPECYDEWIVQPRERLAQCFRHTLEELAILHEKTRDYTVAIQYLQRLLHNDPLREATYRHLMRLHALNGDRGKSLETFEHCRYILNEELAASPSQATLNVYNRLKLVESEPRRWQGRTEQPIPFIGRQAEWERLQTAWGQAVKHKPHLALISGVAGIGKTRLAEELIGWANKQGYATATTRTYAVDRPLAYAPLIGWLRTPTLRRAISQLDSVWQAELSRLLPELLTESPHLPRPEPLTENWQRQRLFEAIGRVVCRIEHPLILFIDDLQWCDEQTLDCLNYLLRLDPEPDMLVVGTLRPEEKDHDKSLSNLLTTLYMSRQLTEIRINPLDQTESATLAAHIVGRYLDVGENVRLFQETEGNALFIVEMMRTESPFTRIPDTVQAIIEHRLRQLSPPARRLADLAAIVGREFSFAVLTQASEDDEQSLLAVLDECCHRFIIREQNSERYDFTHDKIREVAYHSISRARRRFLHRRIAQVLEAMSHAIDLSAELAYHYTEAGNTEKAVHYRLEAGKQALALSAHHEAIRHLQQGLSLLNALPHTLDRDQTELKFLMALSSALIPQKGFTAPEVGAVYDQAIQVVNRLDDEPRLIPFLYGVGQYYTFRQRWTTTHTLAAKCLHLAQKTGKQQDLLFAHGLMGIAFAYSRHHTSSLEHLRQSLMYYEQLPASESGIDDLSLMCRSHAALMLWILGYPDQALEEFRQALRQGHALSHMHGLALTLNNVGIGHILRREPIHAQTYAGQAIALCAKHEFPFWHGLANISLGWSMAHQKQFIPGLEAIRQGLDTLHVLGTSVVSYTHTLLADIYLFSGDIVNGLLIIDDAIKAATDTQVETVLSMTLRVKGDLLSQSGAPPDEVETAYQQAIEFAQAQEAKSFELQATISLCRFYQQHNRIGDAQRMLTAIYNWFTEGFDAPDLREARVLLDELA